MRDAYAFWRLPREKALQRKTMSRLSDKLTSGGVLIIGALESLPNGSWGIEPWPMRQGMYKKL